ncbi:MAG: flagellar biosynthesis protein FlhF, partial [Gammaproteobacteria bacterium]|nr:flagellar biosynthesis protein FlhF [Gammaproteobacteria bacterium]
MRIKRFVAPEMRDAIRAVREDLGPDAVILSNRDVEGGVEIVAAHDLEDTLRAEADSDSPRSEPTTDQRTPVPQVAEEPVAPAPEVRRLEEEIRHLRGLLEDQLCGLAWGDFGRRHPLRATIFRRLIAIGLSHNLAADLAKSGADTSEPKEAWRAIVSELEQRVLIGQRDLISHGGVIAFVGPTGVGKTTTIAKVAARFAMRNGPESIALITTDSYRVGAQEQLRTFAN